MERDLSADAYSSRPRDKIELIARIHRERAALEAAISSLDEVQMIAPGAGGWSIKDLLAHITTWEQVLLVHDLQSRSFAEAAGMDEATAAATAEMTAETGLNDYFYERDKDRSLADVLAGFRRSHHQILAALEELDDADLSRPNDPDDPESRLIDSIVGDTYAHYREHCGTIEAMFGRNRHAHSDG
jgi:uncharacterized protein (TIGR03083 family)